MNEWLIWSNKFCVLYGTGRFITETELSVAAAETNPVTRNAYR
jgi:hypothetical protein